MWPLQNIQVLGGGAFIHVPIYTSAHTAWYHFTNHIEIHSVFCTTLLHNITKGVYLSRHIPNIRTRCRQIPDMFWCRSQYQVNPSKCISQSHPTHNPHTSRLIVLSINVSDSWRRKVYTTTQYNGPYICVSVTSLPSIFPNYSQKFLFLEIVYYISIQSIWLF